MLANNYRPCIDCDQTTVICNFDKKELLLYTFNYFLSFWKDTSKNDRKCRKKKKNENLWAIKGTPCYFIIIIFCLKQREA